MSDIRSRIMQFTAKPVETDTEMGKVHIRRLTLGEVDAMRKESEKKPVVGEIEVALTVRLFSRFLGDEAGKPVFDPTKPADVDAINALPVSFCAEVLRAGNRVNKMTEEASGKD